MFAIKASVGPTEYTPAAHTGWCKILSVILDFIVPAVVQFELENREAAQQIIDKRMGRMGSTGSAASLATTSMLNGQLSYRDPGADFTPVAPS